MVRLTVDQAELNSLKAAFQELDSDNTGSISTSKFNIVDENMKHFGMSDKWSEILQNIDLDGNGRIDFHEFYTAAVDHKKVFND